MNKPTNTVDVTQALSLINGVTLPNFAELTAPGCWVIYPVFGYEGEIVASGVFDPDFLESLVTWLGAIPSRALCWEFGGVRVGPKKRLGLPLHEDGWRRFHLAGIDGITRSADFNAPILMLTPRNQAIYQLTSRHKPRPLNTITDLVEFVCAYASREVAA